jgi:uncharacterized protein YjbI with pentapeptide repeats
MNRFLSCGALALVLSAALSACGGGGGADRVILPIDDDAPHAYTTQYLALHPEAVIQPEHLLIVELDPQAPNGGATRVRLHVREPLSMQMGPPAGGTASQVLAEVIVQDSSGAEKMHYVDGNGPVQLDLQPGEHVITFVPKAGLAQARSVFMKLADTPAQIARRVQAPVIGMPEGTQMLQQTKFGVDCISCDFDNANLTSATFNSAAISYSTFHNARIDNVDFSWAFCIQCQLTADANSGQPIENSNFDHAVLELAVLDRPWFSANTFRGAAMAYATLRGPFVLCNFGPYIDAFTSPENTDLNYADLRSARFGPTDVFTSASFLSASAAGTTFALNAASSDAVRTAFTGAIFDNVVPGTLFVEGGQSFVGYDLSGTSFAGIDLSTQDWSADAGTIMSATTDISKATLSDGTVGINLSGQAVFPVGYTGFAGSVADQASGRNLAHVNFSNVSLSQADLTRARLDGAILIGADLTYANLYGASLKAAQLGVAPGTGTQSAARLSGAYMPGADFSDADLRSVSLEGAHIYGTGVSFVRARLDGASLTGAFLMQASFVSASLNNTDLSGAALVNVVFDAATLSNAKFNGAYLQGADFASAASVVGVDLTNAAMSTGSGNWQFTELDGTPYTYAYVATALGQIAASSQVVCPSGAQGPCSAGKLLPLKVPPYPVQPPCIPLRKYSYQNCESGWVPPKN